MCLGGQVKAGGLPVTQMTVIDLYAPERALENSAKSFSEPQYLAKPTSFPPLGTRQYAGLSSAG